MKFYVQLLGFSEEEGGIIEIYPTSNQFDIGFVDLYTLESSFNDISFQTPFNEIFKYWPSSNNNLWKLETDMKYDTELIRLVGSTLDNDTYLWLENERIKIVESAGINTYYIQRGKNNSIPVNHFYTTDSNNIVSIPILSSTLKRLSPIGIICKFYSTDNIGGNETTMGYGQISNITLSNSKLLTINCKQLYKMLDKTYLFNNTIRDDYINLWSILNKDPDYISPVSNEFIRMLDVPDWIDNNFYVECKKLTETSTQTKSIKLTDIFQQLLKYNNGFVKFNPTTGRYSIQKLGIQTSIDTSMTNVFITSYLTINDSNIEVKPFERISTLNGKFKKLSLDEDGKLVSNDGEILIKDDIIEMVSSKSIDFDIGSLYLKPESDVNIFAKKLKDKIYFLNQVYDELTITTTRWKKQFEIGKRYVFNDSHIIKTLNDIQKEVSWICMGYEDKSCKFISMEPFSRYLISPFRKLTHSTGDIWIVSPLTKQTNDLILPYNNYQVNDILYVYTYDNTLHTVTTTTKTISAVTLSGNYRITLSGLSTDTNYSHFITYNLGTPTNKYSLFLYEENGVV